jgi:hypothetical protein
MRPADIDLLPAPPGCYIRRTRRYDYPQIVFGPEGMETVRHAVAVSYAGYVSCRFLSRAELRRLRSASKREITFTGNGGDIGLDGYLIGIDVQTIMQGRPYSEDDFRAELADLAELVRKVAG